MTTQATCTEPYYPINERWKARRKFDIEKAIEIVAKYFDETSHEIKGEGQRGELCLCRAIIYKILYRHSRITQEEIGEIFGRDRTSVIHGIRALTGWMEIYPEIRNHFETIEKIVLADE